MGRRANSIWLSAIGDAWGRWTEMVDFESIPEHVPMTDPMTITDDTQMALAVLHGIDDAMTTDHRYIDHISERFIEWLYDKDNNRGPGRTCLTALRSLDEARRNGKDRTPWVGTVEDSKGCGANMRAPWIGLLSIMSLEELETLGVGQAFITHGHDTALDATRLTVHGTFLLANHHIPPGSLVEHLTIGTNQEILSALDRAQSIEPSQMWEKTFDPCSIVGGGWVAEDALALAARIADVYHDNPKEGLHRAVRTGGDSDSIACITGSFLGAGWDGNWRELFPDVVFEPRYQQELTWATGMVDSIKPMEN